MLVKWIISPGRDENKKYLQPPEIYKRCGDYHYRYVILKEFKGWPFVE